MTKEVKGLKRRLGQLTSYRSNFEQAWDDCRTYAAPQSPAIYGEEVNPGERSRRNYSSTAEYGIRDLTSVLQSSITNPSTKWVQIESTDKEANKEDDVKRWFEEVEETITKSLENSNAYIKLSEFYHSLACFGTAVMLIEDGEGPYDLNFRTFHISEAYVAENHMGYVDTVFRKFKMTAREMVQEFGLDNVSDKIKMKYEKEPDQRVDIVHAVFPRDDEDREKKGDGTYREDSKSMPWASIWFEYEGENVLKESGYRLFPFAVARWTKNSGEVYGRSPIMQAMADIKTLNRALKTKIQLAEKIANPPIATVGAESADIDLTPGAVNPFDEEVNIEWLVPGGNYPITDAATDELKQEVQQALFVNQLYNINMVDKEMTAREVQARQMENLRVLGPVFSRIQNELLEPFINRVIDVLMADGKIRPAPEVLANSEFKYRFVSPLTRAQNQDDIQTIEYSIGRAVEFASISPEVMDNIDLDAAYKKLVELSGAPLVILRPDIDVRKLREARAEQMAMQQQIQMQAMQAEMAEKQSETSKNLSQAEKNRRAM